ncbi:MAG: O-antigen ligase family protein [Verrucomicrobia bacterium]|nr:O-antigen ligase family protein [Verrucomicrobiota bacterium]
MTKHWLNEIVVAIWASASFYIMHFTSAESAAPLFFPLAAGTIVLIFLTYKKPVIATVSPLLSLGVFMLNLSILASYLFNAQRYDWVFIVGNISSSLLFFFSLYLITMRLDLDLRKTLIFISILVNLLLPIILVTSPVTWGRVNPPENPNYVAMMALLAFIGALSARSIVCAATLAALPLYSMVVLQSRDSLLAAAIALVFAVVSWTRRNESKMFSTYLLLAFFGSVTVCALMTLSGSHLWDSVGQTFDNLFMIDDKYRGIGSGGSGRDDLWAAAINLWEAEPIFGVGFKGHTLLMPNQLPAHNAYLAMLADTGVIGLASYFLMMSPAIYFLFKPTHRFREDPLSATIIVTYILYGAFEVRAFSFGNTYSVVFLLIVFNCSKQPLVPVRPVQLNAHAFSPTRF